MTPLVRISLFISFLLTATAAIAQPAAEKEIQTWLILAQDGDEISLPEGKIELSGTLWLDGKNDIIIRGAGEGKTILSFKNQKQGAEGLKVTNCRNITLEQFTIEDSKGDLIKAQEVAGLDMRQITAQWSGKPKASNGSYALYPVQCSRVTIDRCTAIGASDAGIYVGQSDSVWVSNCTARHNVAGIEIENTTNAWVWNNLATENTGGILVFDLPDLLKKKGGFCEVWNNRVVNNNYRNFAPKGNIVGQVPAGTGVMLLAANHVNVHDNKILGNKTASVAIVSYLITEIPIKDKSYNPYPYLVSVSGNEFSKGKRMPSLKHDIGKGLYLKFRRKAPHILYDGIMNPEFVGADGQLKPDYRICIGDNVNGSFANIKADKRMKGISRDTGPYQCKE